MKRLRGRAPMPGALFLPRNSDTNKGDYGRVLIVAGSDGMSGAAVLCARAALRAGAGLVTVAVPAPIQPVVAACVPEAMTLGLPHRKGVITAVAGNKLEKWLLAGGCDLILAGPGLGSGAGVDAVVKRLLLQEKPLVLDADALNSLARTCGGSPLGLPAGRCIITPHPGEASRLLRKTVAEVQGSRRASAEQLSGFCGGVAVLKGQHTVIADCAGRSRTNTTGGPELAKGGSGDVLAGLLAGLWVQRGKQCGFSVETAFESAVAGVFAHGLCGQLAARELGEKCVMAGDLLYFLPQAFRAAARKL